MRGIGSTFSRLPKVAAWLAGAAFLAGTMAPGAQAQTDETAMAVPRLAPLGSDGVVLPHPLAAADAVSLRRLFADLSGGLPAPGAIDLNITINDAMLGHALAARYLAPARRARPAALQAWIARYPDLPDAPAMAALLHRRDASFTIPAALIRTTAMPAAPVPHDLPLGSERVVRNPLLDETLRLRLHEAGFDSARRLIARTRGLGPDYAATLTAELAQALFTANDDQAALATAQAAIRRAHGRVGLADYIAGLAAWRLGHADQAAIHFAAASAAPIATDALHAAGAYWAARACQMLPDPSAWRAWMRNAGAQRHTFYGQIANRALGRAEGMGFSRGVLGEADVAAVAAQPGGLRAFALLQIDQPGRAEAELRLLAAGIDQQQPGLLRAVMLVAERAGFYDLAADIAASLPVEAGQARESEPLPMPRLRPGHGFLMDPALVYALTRIESNFDPHAVSSMGAQGLMQLMPGTAGSMASRAGTQHLHDPAVNLDLGQRYVAYLSGHDAVDGDLIRLLASYNAGPAAFARWSSEIRDFNDPLLFIEAIPNPETRQFVQRALAYTWIYAERLRLPAPSLDALAIIRRPRFARPDPVQHAVLH